MKQDNQPVFFEGVQCSEHYYMINEQVSLKVIKYVPDSASRNIPVVMVGGLSTIIESLQNIIGELTRDFPVYYIETREKASSKIYGNVPYDIETIGKDIAAIIRMLGMEQDKYIMMGYSFGATAIADCYRFIESRPRCLIFMEPTPVFHYPAWGLQLIRWSGPFFFLLKPFAKLYLSRFVINTSEDNEMAVISSETLDHADPRKLRNTILAISGYLIWDRLESIDCPVLIIAASKDHLHVHSEITRMKSMIKKCAYIDLETNKRTHSAEMAHVIRKYVNDLNLATDSPSV